VQRKPRGFVGTLAHFHRLLKLDIQRRTALVESAVSLTPEMQNKIGVSLGARHGMGLDVQFTASPALIGGLRVKVGSDVYDGSVAGRLAALADSF
jgi:F-type H+-transporting ATPase subunit delta